MSPTFKASATGVLWERAGPFEAQVAANAHAAELGVQTVPSPNIVYTREGGYIDAALAAAAGYQVGVVLIGVKRCSHAKSSCPFSHFEISGCDFFCPASRKFIQVQKLSGTKFRQMLRAGQDIPSWFAFPVRCNKKYENLRIIEFYSFMRS